MPPRRYSSRIRATGGPTFLPIHHERVDRPRGASPDVPRRHPYGLIYNQSRAQPSPPFAILSSQLYKVSRSMRRVSMNSVPIDHSPKMAAEKTSVLIVGAGEFGASTALALLRSGRYGKITILDKASSLPAKDAASCDINKVVRNDYADPDYAQLARKAIEEWQKPEWNGIFFQSGAVVRGLHVDGPFGQAVRATFDNVRQDNPTVELLETTEAFQAKLAHNPKINFRNTRPEVRGYFNGWGGWANATKAIEKLYTDLTAMGGELVSSAELLDLLYTPDGQDVVGVKCVDGREFLADKVILALGSWTPSHPALEGMLPEGLVTATGQAIAAVQLDNEEREIYKEIPVSMHIDGSGYYSFPPKEEGLLKFSIHGAGFTSESGKPRTMTDSSAVKWASENGKGWIPKESLALLRAQLDIIYPTLAAMDGDWVIDYSPKYSSLFIATGGAGHAFKFLPIMGDLILARLENRLEQTWQKRWSARRIPHTIDPGRVGMQRKPLKLDQLVDKEDMLVA